MKMRVHNFIQILPFEAVSIPGNVARSLTDQGDQRDRTIVKSTFKGRLGIGTNDPETLSPVSFRILQPFDPLWKMDKSGTKMFNIILLIKRQCN